MAFTLEQTPTALVGFRDPIVYVFQDTTNTGDSKYRYILEVSIYNGSTYDEVALLKRYPNNSSNAVFDIGRILTSHARTTARADKPGSGELFANANAAVQYKVRYGYESSTGSDTAPTSTWEGYDSVRFAVDARYLSLKSTISGGGVLDDYILDDATKKVLTLSENTEQVFRVSDTEKGSFTFISDDSISSDPDSFILTFYDAAGSMGAPQTILVSSAGGSSPSSGTRDSVFQHAFLWPYYLEATSTSAWKPSSYSDWTHYTVYAFSLTASQSSAPVKFIRDNDCRPYSPLKFQWKNRLGGWDEVYSDGKVRRSTKLSRENITVGRGDYYGASTSFDVVPGDSSVITELTREHRYKVVFQPDDSVRQRLVESLVETRYAFAWLYEPGGVTETFYPIVITTTEIESLTSENDKVAKYTIEFTMANETEV